MFFDGGRILWPLLLWLTPVLLFTTPAAAAGNHASSASSWILIGIAVTLVVLIGVSLWLFRRSEKFGGTARLRGKTLDALPQATMVATIASAALQTNAVRKSRVPECDEGSVISSNRRNA
jgi:hypothetical protein